MSTNYVTYQIFEHRLQDLKEMKNQYATEANLKSTKTDLLQWMIGCAGATIVGIAGIIFSVYLIFGNHITSLDNRVGALDNRVYTLSNEVHQVKREVAILSNNVETINKTSVKLTAAIERLESNAQTTNETLLKLATAVENLQKKEKS